MGNETSSSVTANHSDGISYIMNWHYWPEKYFIVNE